MSYGLDKKKIMVLILMSAIIALVYQPVLENGFLTNWDDQWMVLDNPHLEQTDGIDVESIFTEAYGGQYSPLNTLAYYGIAKAAGKNAFAFHLFSLLVHLANFVLVGFILEKLLTLFPDLKLNKKTITGLAWATALLFAIHPLQVESVAWVSASKIVLFSFFYLLGLWFYLLYKHSQKFLYLFIVLVCFLASLLAKEQAVVFIISLVVIDLVIHKNLKQKVVWLEKIPFVIVALFLGLFTFFIQQGIGVGGSYPFGHRLLFANYSFWEYLVKLTAPHNLSYFYFFPMDPGQSVPLRFWFYLLATGIFSWVLYEYRHTLNRVYLFGGLFFLVNIALVLHILPLPRATIIADRYIYLSSIGFFLIIAYGLIHWTAKKQEVVQKVTITVCCIYVLALALFTHQRTKAWNDMETLQQDIQHVTERHLGQTPSNPSNLLISSEPCTDDSINKEQLEESEEGLPEIK